ncbi:39S ribosomal protein L35, mitochondrial [Leptopilina heterotoma]|uniref:39S ribosomal protein L35, mitochondrial n=1 Tax=Leptopilina heterotoma TaxID=63436 RepID=UPI001CAA3A09|nr:39S ribosomal protein L35, mitochondrial [Leptopilina heterotoma]
MLRIVSSAIRAGVQCVSSPSFTNLIKTSPCTSTSIVNSICLRSLSLNTSHIHKDVNIGKNRTLLSAPLAQSILPVIQQPTVIANRNLIKYSMRKGKRKTVKTVVTRFYRLRWGIWIRTKCGRTSNLWRKSLNRKKRLYRHVFCNAKQSWLLDKMITPFWARPKYYVDDPYEPYHERENFDHTRKRPLP